MGEKKFKTTKVDERAALELIRNILAELDPEGYVNTAFEGCCEMAESNIDNDFACSYKSSVEILQEELRKMRVAQGDLETRFNTVNKFYKHRGDLLEACNEQIDHLKSENKKLQIENELLQAALHSADSVINAYKKFENIANERIEKLKKTNENLLDLLNKVKRF